MRIGTKKRPFYRIVAVDERKKRTGQYIELLGTYNPLTEPKEIILKKDLIEKWQKNGAVLSDGFLRIIGQAPQRPPRKPKKEKEVKQPKVEEKKPEVETVVEEAPVTTEETGTAETSESMNDEPTNK